MPEKNKDFLGARAAHRTGTEPRWPAVLAILAVGGLNAVLPEPLSFGPYWLILAIVSVLLIPTVITYRTGRRELNQVLGHLVLATVTSGMIWSLGMLIARLPNHLDPPKTLLLSAAALWTANVLVLAVGRRRAQPARPPQGS